MKRYFLSRVVGTGTEEDPFRAKIQDAAVSQRVNMVASIPSDPVTGRPLFAYALVRVSCQDFNPLLNDADNDGLPDITLDSTLSVLSNKQYNTLLTVLANRLGINTSSITKQTTFGEVIDLVGKALDGPGFSRLRFDCADVV